MYTVDSKVSLFNYYLFLTPFSLIFLLGVSADPGRPHWTILVIPASRPAGEPQHTTIPHTTSHTIIPHTTSHTSIPHTTSHSTNPHTISHTTITHTTSHTTIPHTTTIPPHSYSEALQISLMWPSWTITSWLQSCLAWYSTTSWRIRPSIGCVVCMVCVCVCVCMCVWKEYYRKW